MTAADQAQAAADQLRLELDKLGLVAHVHIGRHRQLGLVVVAELEPTAALQLVTKLRTQDTGKRRRKDDQHPGEEG